MRQAAAAATLVAGVAGLGLALGPAPAQAAAASSAEVRALARAAPADPAALRRLRGVDRVDGRPVALGRLLAGTDRRVLAGRLAVLAAAPSPADGDGGRSGRARDDARAILAERRFRGSSLPRPLRSPLQRLGDWVERVLRALAGATPGGAPVFWSLLAAAVLAAVAALTTRRVRRQVSAETASALHEARAGEDPRALEREADEAERDGDGARAIRLRFRAGVLHLAAAGVVELGPGFTSGAIARRLRSPDFDAVRASFDAVAYGGRRADVQEAADARRRWRAILAEHRPARRVAAPPRPRAAA